MLPVPARALISLALDGQNVRLSVLSWCVGKVNAERLLETV